MKLEQLLGKPTSLAKKARKAVQDNLATAASLTYLTAAFAADRTTTILCVNKYGQGIESSPLWAPLFNSDFGLYAGASLINIGAIAGAAAVKMGIEKKLKDKRQYYAKMIWHMSVLGIGTASIYAAAHNYFNCFHLNGLPMLFR